MNIIEKIEMYLSEACPGDKKKSKGKGKGLGKGKGEGPIGRLKDEVSEADVKAYMNDPLYKAVLKSKSQKEYDKSMTTLRSIRGDSAVNDFIRMLKK